jgi:tRNA pseudouridine13 synthase
MSDSFNLDFPRAHGAPPIRAILKAEPEDFFVEEQFDFTPTGSGEHEYLFIEKRDLNTQDVVKMLAHAAGIKPGDVGYSGMKDKRAITRQWFSLYLPKQATFSLPADERLTVLRRERHTQKLRHGSHHHNFFRITLRDVQGDMDALAARIEIIQQHGVPNYFGEQRFGHNGNNLRQADALIARAKGKQQRQHDRLLVSAARSWLFNRVLSVRVSDLSWNRVMDGDQGQESTAPLWGRGRLSSAGSVREQEERVMLDYQLWCHFLEHCGLQQERRALQLLPQGLRWQLEGSALTLEFSLPAGTYATTLLRELVSLGGEA